MLFLTVLLLVLNKVTSRFRSDKYDKTVEVNYKGKLKLKFPVVCYGNKIYCKNIKPIIGNKIIEPNQPQITYNEKLIPFKPIYKIEKIKDLVIYPENIATELLNTSSFYSP